MYRVTAAKVFLLVSVLAGGLCLADEHEAHDASAPSGADSAHPPEASPSTPERLSPVKVYASRLPADHVDPASQTASVTIIEGHAIASQVATLADVLSTQPGVQIRQSGGLGSYSTVYLRGSSSQQVNVFLDGVLLNDASGGTVDMSQFLLSQIERIEIYRGAVPIQLGTGAIGGAIHIVTKKGREEPFAKVQAGYGSFDSRKLAGTWSKPWEQGNLLLGLDYLGSENDFDFINDNQTELNPLDDFEDTRHNAGFDQLQGLFNLYQRLANEYELDVIAQYFDKQQSLPDLRNLPSTQSSLDTTLATLQARLGYSDDGIALDGKAYGSQRKETYDDSQGRIGLGREREETRIDVAGLAANASLAWQDHLFAITLDGRHETAETHDLTSREIATSASRNQVVLGLQDEWANADGTWLLNLGGRIYHVIDKAPGIDGAGEPLDSSERNTESTLQSGLQYRLDSSTTLHASVASEVRIPQLTERFGNRGFLLGNPDLQPESAENIEFGAQLQVDDGRLSSAVFYRNLDQAIVALYDSRGVGRFENVSKARIAGIEFEIDWTLWQGLQFALNSTLQDSKNLSDSRDQNGKQLAGLYRQSHNLSLTHVTGPFTNTLHFQHESGAYYDNSESLAVKDRNLLGWTGKWTHNDFALELNLENLTDEQVEDFNGFPAPGRSTFATLSQVF